MRHPPESTTGIEDTFSEDMKLESKDEIEVLSSGISDSSRGYGDCYGIVVDCGGVPGYCDELAHHDGHGSVGEDRELVSNGGRNVATFGVHGGSDIDVRGADDCGVELLL